MSKQQYFFLILILGSLSALGPFSIDMYLPGFPAIAQDLNTTAARVTLSLSSFFIGISAGQLLYGPLLDRFGRKKPLYVGLLVYVLASLGCAAIHTINGLIVLRLVQAVGSCAAGVAAMAMVRDLFPVKDSAKVFALIMLVIGLSPMIAPTAGGYVTTAFGWQAVFVVLAAMGALLLGRVAGAAVLHLYVYRGRVFLRPVRLRGWFAPGVHGYFWGRCPRVRLDFRLSLRGPYRRQPGKQLLAAALPE